MKNYIKQTAILLLMLSTTASCYSQSVTIDINDSQLGQPVNYYSKDLNNILDQFEGTYTYSNSTITFKIVMKKKIKQYNGYYYEDLIIGEYQLIENGIEKINTLSNLDVVYNNQFVKHNIAGNYTIENNNRRWKCPQCFLNEQRLSAVIKDSNNTRTADLFVRKILVNGQQAIQINIKNVYPSFESITPPPFSLPLGELTFLKQ